MLNKKYLVGQNTSSYDIINLPTLHHPHEMNESTFVLQSLLLIYVIKMTKTMTCREEKRLNVGP
jgi:hypothetical protein